MTLKKCLMLKSSCCCCLNPSCCCFFSLLIYLLNPAGLLFQIQFLIQSQFPFLLLKFPKLCLFFPDLKTKELPSDPQRCGCRSFAKHCSSDNSSRRSALFREETWRGLPQLPQLPQLGPGGSSFYMGVFTNKMGGCLARKVRTSGAKKMCSRLWRRVIRWFLDGNKRFVPEIGWWWWWFMLIYIYIVVI